MTNRHHSCPACDVALAEAEKMAKENFIKKGKLNEDDDEETDNQKET